MRILLVDDDPDIRLAAETSLNLVDDWSCRSVASGAEAVVLFETEDFDLVLLDIMMPEMDGPSTLEALRRVRHNFSVIFLTAKVEKRWIDRTLALGARGFIPKPFDTRTLADEVRRILGC